MWFGIFSFAGGFVLLCYGVVCGAFILFIVLPVISFVVGAGCFAFCYADFAVLFAVVCYVFFLCSTGCCAFALLLVLPFIIFVYEFWYVAGGCGLMMCWCGWDDKIGLLLSSCISYIYNDIIICCKRERI